LATERVGSPTDVKKLKVAGDRERIKKSKRGIVEQKKSIKGREPPRDALDVAGVAKGGIEKESFLQRTGLT